MSGKEPPAWAVGVSKGGGPIYAAVADAIEAAVRDGRLAPGDRLPPQRRLAQALGVDLTTITRAYAEAGARRRPMACAPLARPEP
jgi:DNA-binding transcriptional MocR family regulator